MNLINLIKFGAAAVALLFAYWVGVQDGHDSEELKNARAQIVQLSETVKTYEAHYKNQAIAMAELRVSESAARADSDRLRSRIAKLEKGARTDADRDAIRCLELGAECRRLLLEARGIINYCRKTFGGENTWN